VTVNGDEFRPGSSHGRPVARRGHKTPVPIGTTTLVRCGVGTRAALAGLRDPEAAADAAGCGTNEQQCQQSATDPNNTDAALRVQKGADGAWTLNGGQCVAPLASAKPVVTAADVRAQVVRLIPTAAIGLAPRTATLVNIQTIMWVAAPGRRTLAAVQILGQRVDISLRLARVAWSFGDGHGESTSWPGKAYDATHAPCRTRMCAGYFGHVYDRTGRVRLTATAQWAASFTVNGGAAQQIPGTVAGPTAASTLVVKQARSVLVPN
jgi:hypothetical protein